MPFTPLHLGFGLTAAMLVRQVDFWAFALVNVLIDVEVGWNLWRGNHPAHRCFHTLVGATVLIVPAVAVTIAATRLASRYRWGRPSRLGAALLGAALGAWSHVLLDAITHGGARPWAPWSDRDPLLDIVSERAVDAACVAAIVVGVALAAWRWRAARRG